MKQKLFSIVTFLLALFMISGLFSAFSATKQTKKMVTESKYDLDDDGKKIR